MCGRVRKHRSKGKWGDKGEREERRGKEGMEVDSEEENWGGKSIGKTGREGKIARKSSGEIGRLRRRVRKGRKLDEMGRWEGRRGGKEKGKTEKWKIRT